MDDTAQMFDDARADLVYHLAAEVGGIGANRANPGRYWYANLMMGAHVLEQARLHETPKVVIVGHGLRLPEVRPGAVLRGRPLGRLPGGDERAVRRREEGRPRRRTGVPRAVRPERDLPAPDQPLRAARQLRPRDVACHPGAHPEDDRVGRGGRALGRRLPDAGVPVRRRLRGGARPGSRALRRARPRQPRRRDARSRFASSPSSSPTSRATRAASRGTRRSRTASRVGAWTRRARASCSGSRRGRRCERGSSTPPPGTARQWPVSVRSASLDLRAPGRRRRRPPARAAPRGPRRADRRADRRDDRARALRRPQRLGLVPGRRPDLADRRQGWLLGQLELPPTELGVPVVATCWRRSCGSPGRRTCRRCRPLVLLQVARARARSRCSASTTSPPESAGGFSATGHRSSGSSRRSPRSRSSSTATRSAWASSSCPQALGLTAMSDFPSMVLVLAAARLRRALARAGPADRRGRSRALLLGAAGALKPPNLLLGVGAALAYLVARRWRDGHRVRRGRWSRLCSLLARGRNGARRDSRSFALEEARIAAGSTADGGRRSTVDRYLDIDFDHWRDADGPAARVLLERATRPVGAVRRAPRGAPRAPGRDRRAPRWLARGVPRRQGILSARDHRVRTRSGACSCPPGPRTSSCFASIPLLVPTLARRLGDRVRTRPRPRAPCRALDRRRGRRSPSLVPAAAIAASSPLERPDPRGHPGRPGQLHPDLRSTRASSFKSSVTGRRQHASPGTTTPTGARTSSTACTAASRRGRRVREHRTAILRSRATSAATSDRDDPRARVRRRLRAARSDVPDRRRHELDRRPGGRRRVRLQSARGGGRLTRSSRSAIRCARSTFSSVSFEITVE